MESTKILAPEKNILTGGKISVDKIQSLRSKQRRKMSPV